MGSFKSTNYSIFAKVFISHSACILLDIFKSYLNFHDSIIYLLKIITQNELDFKTTKSTQINDVTRAQNMRRHFIPHTLSPFKWVRERVKLREWGPYFVF